MCYNVEEFLKHADLKKPYKKRPHTGQHHSYGMSRIGKSTDTESRSAWFSEAETRVNGE